MVNYDTTQQDAFNASGGAGFDAMSALKALQAQLTPTMGGMGGSSSPSGFGAPPMQQPMGGPANYGTPSNGQPFQSLGAWYNPQNPYLNPNRGLGTAQVVSGNGQLYDWEAPPQGALDFMRSPGFDWSGNAFNSLAGMFPSQAGPMAGPGQMQGDAWIPPDMQGMFPQQGGMEGGGLESLLRMLGLDPYANQQTQIGPDRAFSQIPGTYSIGGGIQGAGGMQGANPFAGDTSGRSGVDRLAELSGGQGNVPNFIKMLSAGKPIADVSNMNDTLQQLGQFGGTPSPQSLGNMNWSEQQMLQGFFESILGIPWEDIMSASGAPFQGLNTARKPRRSYKNS